MRTFLRINDEDDGVSERYINADTIDMVKLTDTGTIASGPWVVEAIAGTNTYRIGADGSLSGRKALLDLVLASIGQVVDHGEV